MFKNLIIFRLKHTWSTPFNALEEQAQKFKFAPCGPTQPRSSGWIEPRGHDNGLLVEGVNNHWFMKLCIETKVVPGSVIKRAVKDRIDLIEKQTGKKPGKKESKEIKEDVILDLMPKAFSKIDSVSVWIDPVSKFVIVDAGSLSKADVIISALVQTFEGFGVDLLMTKTSPQTAMSLWLRGDGAPSPLDIGQEVELKAMESKSVVKYSKHNLNIDEIKEHIAAGKIPTKLAMLWNERVSFTLTDTLAIKKLTFADVVFEDGAGSDKDNKEDGFDADMTILTGEIKEMIPGIIEVLDGEMFQEGVQAPT